MKGLEKFKKDFPEHISRAEEKSEVINESLRNIKGYELSNLSGNPKWMCNGSDVCISNPAHGRRHGLGKNYIDSVLNGNASIHTYENPMDDSDKVLMFIRNKDKKIMEMHGPGNSNIKNSEHFKNTIKNQGYIL